MAQTDFTFSDATTAADAKAEKADAKDPQAYIFIGVDDFRSDERTPQEWRKLFVCLARAARGKGGKVSQNQFGLSIVYDRLTELEKAAKTALGAKFKAVMDKHWTDALAEDAARAAKRAARKAAATATTTTPARRG